MLKEFVNLCLLEQELRRDFALPDRCDIDPELLKSLKVVCIGSVANRKVWMVDGEIIRDAIDIDFTMGGNPARYAYVPQDELWLESSLQPKDFAATLLHEACETWLMERMGMSYDQAHDAASQPEKMLRSNFKDVSESMIVPLVCKLYDEFISSRGARWV